MKFTLTQSLIATVGMGNAIRNFLKCNVRVVYIFCCLLDNNVGYSNAKTGASLGWKTNIESWDTFGITPPANTKVAVRASMYSDNPEVESGNWDIDVFAFCEILNS